MDTAALARDRDQLWGEAVVAYKAGAAWWLSEAVEKVAAQEQKDRLLEDPWQANVLEIIAKETEICVPKIMAEMAIETARRDRASSNRVVSILMQNGWIRSGKFTTGSWAGQSRYVPRKGMEQAAKAAEVAPVAEEDLLDLRMEKDVF